MHALAPPTVAFAFALAACVQPATPPTDKALIERLAADRTGFETVIELMASSPAIERVERRPDGSWVILPNTADPRRTAAVREFMATHEISSVALKTSQPAEAWFVVFEGVPEGLEYQSKTLIHGGPGADWRLVDDTDEDLRQPIPEARVVYRSIGDNWYIRNSAF